MRASGKKGSGQNGSGPRGDNHVDLVVVVAVVVAVGAELLSVII